MNELTLEPQPELSYTPGRAIPLTQGQLAVVDADDYDWLMQWKWYANWSDSTKSFYAQRNLPLGPKRRTMLSMSRAILNAPAGTEVDHKNHDTLHNQRYNLRLASKLQNVANKGVHRKNKLGIRGVCWHKASQQYIAQINENGKRIHLGCFPTAEEASAAYETAAKRVFGEFYNPLTDHGTPASQ